MYQNSLACVVVSIVQSRRSKNFQSQPKNPIFRKFAGHLRDVRDRLFFINQTKPALDFSGAGQPVEKVSLKADFFVFVW